MTIEELKRILEEEIEKEQKRFEQNHSPLLFVNITTLEWVLDLINDVHQS